MSSQIDFDPIDQGSSWTKTLQLNDSNGNPLDLTGCTAELQFRSYYNDLYADLTLGNGILISGGLITLTLTPDQTASFLMSQLYYDFDLTWPTGQKNTLFTGQVDVNLWITHPLPIIAGDFLADFSDPVNSMYGFIFPFGIGFNPTDSSAPLADFSDLNNSQYGFLFNMAGYQPPITIPLADFSDPDNSGYIALLSLA